MDPSVSIFSGILFIFGGGAVLAIIRFALGLLNALANSKTASTNFGSIGEGLHPFAVYLKAPFEAIFGPLAEMKHNLIHVLLAAILLAIIFFGSRIPEPSTESSSSSSSSSSSKKSSTTSSSTNDKPKHN